MVVSIRVQSGVKMETWVDSEHIYRGKIISVRVGNVRLDNGSIAKREVVEHSGGVAIVPVRDEAVVLARQFRISVGREVIELPAGKLEDQETPRECALRELEEELGYRATQLVLMTSYYSSVGFTNEKMYIFLGLGLERTKERPEWDEQIQTVEMPISEIETKLSNSEFEDSKTIIGLYELMSYLRKHPEAIKS